MSHGGFYAHPRLTVQHARFLTFSLQSAFFKDKSQAWRCGEVAKACEWHPTWKLVRVPAAPVLTCSLQSVLGKHSRMTQVLGPWTHLRDPEEDPGSALALPRPGSHLQSVNLCLIMPFK